MDDGEIIAEFDDQEGLELEEIENVVIDEAMHDPTEELALELPNSLIVNYEIMDTTNLVSVHMSHSSPSY